MKKLLAIILSLLSLMQLVILPASADEPLTVLSTATYAFNGTDGVYVPSDVSFTVPMGKTVKTLSLNGKTIAEGDGVTPWDKFPSAAKNYTYDSASGNLTLSKRFIGVETDLYGSKTLDFVLEFTDGTKGILSLNGVYNYLKYTGTPSDYSESNISGYKANEIKPDSSWRVSSTAAREKALNLIDGVTNQYHSYYANEGSTIIFRDNVPHYIDIDTGKSTEISGVMYKPRKAGTGGCFTSVIYQGSNDGVNFSDIKKASYAGDLTVKTTKFENNVSYRYYRVYIQNAVSGYGTGDEIHFLKPHITLSDLTIDVSKEIDTVINTGIYGNSVLSVEVDGSAISETHYTFSNHTFKFAEDYIKTLKAGNHTMKICLDDSYTEFNIHIENSAKDLADAKANALNELNAYKKDVAGFVTSIENAATVDAVNETLDSAAASLGAEIITLPYKNTFTVTSGEVLFSSVSGEGIENSDAEVISYADNTVTATGLGRSLIKSGDKFYLVKTTKANIAVVIVSGQSNAAGDSSNYQEAPSAIGKYKGRYLVTNSMNCALPLSKVTWEDAAYAAEHGGRPSDSVISETWSAKGWSAAEANQLGARLSDEWNMTVWVINTGICARIMDDFDPTKETHKAYTHTVNYTNKVKELIAENPHYVLDESKIGFFWLQGCSDGIGTASQNTMEEYTEMFMNMYEGWKDEIGINYAGIWLVRAGVNSNGDKDFYMSGPRLSQLYLGNSQKEEHKNIYLVLNTDIWRTNEGVNDYFTEKYPDADAFKEYYGYDRPSTFKEVKPDLHHRQKGYNELGDEAGRVISLIMAGKTEPMAYASLYNFEGNEVTEDGFTLMINEELNAVPVVTSTNYNASYGLYVTVADSSVAVFDNETYTLRGVSEGITTIYVKYDNKTYASYPVVVEGIQDSVLSDRKNWKITASSIEGTRGNPYNLVDGSTGTSFVADIKLKTPPHHFEITLPENALISGVGFDSYTDANGYPLSYEIYTSESESGKYELTKSGAFDRANDALTLKSQTIDFDDNVNVRKLKFVFTDTVNGYAAMSEFYMYPAKAPATSEPKEIKLTIGNNIITKVIGSTEIPIEFDVAPIIKDGRTFVPVRGIFEIAGAEILWNGEKRAATVKTNEGTVTVTIDKNEADVNGKAVSMDAPPFIKDGRTLIPLRFISENLGYKVNWDGETQTVTITLR